MVQQINAMYMGRPFVIEHNSGIIGRDTPEPCATDEFAVKFGERLAVFYRDGLMKCRIDLFEDSKSVYSITWWNAPAAKTLALKAKLLFKQHVGMDFEIAECLFNEVLRKFQSSQEPDLEYIHYAQG